MTIIQVRPKRDHPNGKLACDYCYEGVNELNRRGTLGMLCDKCHEEVDNQMVKALCDFVGPMLPQQTVKKSWWRLW